MYAVLGEDQSDADTLKVLIRRLADNHSLSVKAVGFKGGSELFRKGVKQLKMLKELGCHRFVICHDADGSDPLPFHNKVRNEIVLPAGLKQDACIVIPVQELEAWILADIEAVTRIFKSWRPKPIANPEKQVSPKEHLIRLSRRNAVKPRYDPPTHNERLANHINLKMVERKCPSFQPLVAFVGQP